MASKIFRVDALSSKPFAGVSIAVCILDSPKERAWMREVSLAMRTTESAFLLQQNPNRFHLRTLAGGTEVQLSAAATVAAAHVLFTENFTDPRRPVAFFTHGGMIPASQSDGRIEVTFPQMLVEELPNSPDEILQGIDSAPEFVGRRGEDYLVQVSSEGVLRNARPDFLTLKAFGMRGLILTSISDTPENLDFVSKTYFISEEAGDDPIASYAHCLLGPFWLLKLSKGNLRGIAIGSPGILELDVDVDRIILTGDAVTISGGELKI